jgi:hypothetical protein
MLPVQVVAPDPTPEVLKEHEGATGAVAHRYRMLLLVLQPRDGDIDRGIGRPCALRRRCERERREHRELERAEKRLEGRPRGHGVLLEPRAVTEPGKASLVVFGKWQDTGRASTIGDRELTYVIAMK